MPHATADAQAANKRKNLTTAQALTEKLPERRQVSWGDKSPWDVVSPSIKSLCPRDSTCCICFIGAHASLPAENTAALAPPFFLPGSPFTPSQLKEVIEKKSGEWFVDFLPRWAAVPAASSTPTLATEPPSVVVVPDILCDREEMGSNGGNEACSVLAGLARSNPQSDHGGPEPEENVHGRDLSGNQQGLSSRLSSFVVIPASRGHLAEACVGLGSEVAFDCREKRDGDRVVFVKDVANSRCVVKQGHSDIVDFLYESVTVVKALDDVAGEFSGLFGAESTLEPSTALRLIDAMVGGGLIDRRERNILAFNGSMLSKQEELGLKGLHSMAETFLLYAEAGEPFRLLREEIHDDLRGKLLVWEKVLSNNRVRLDLRVPNFPDSKGKRFSNLNGVFVGSTPPSVTDVPCDEQREFEEKLAGIVSRLGEALGIFPLIDAVDAGVCVDDLLGALEEG